MTAVLDRILGAGVSLRVVGGRLVARGDLTDDVRADIRAHRDSLLLELIAQTRTHGVLGDGRRVSWDGFILGDDGGVIIHGQCDGDGCDGCRGTGLEVV